MSSILNNWLCMCKSQFPNNTVDTLQKIWFCPEGAQRAEEAVHFTTGGSQVLCWEPSIHLWGGLRTGLSCVSSPVLAHPWGASWALGLPPPLYQEEGGSLHGVQLKLLQPSAVPKTSHHQVWNKQANVLPTYMKFTIHSPLQWHEGRPHPLSQCLQSGNRPQSELPPVYHSGSHQTLQEAGIFQWVTALCQWKRMRFLFIYDLKRCS